MEPNSIDEKVIQSVRMHAVTMIAVDKQGVIRKYLPLSRIPTSTEDFVSLINSPENKGCAVSFMGRDMRYSRSKLLAKIKSSVKALEYGKTHKLKPGVNIPGNAK